MRLPIVLCMMACQVMAWAGVIKGKVIDESKEALEFVNVAVYRNGESAPYKGTITDEKGVFFIDGVKSGEYEVKISFMGFAEQNRSVKLAAGDETINLHNIVLAEDRAVLQEVSVATQRSAMKLDIDKKVFDMSTNIAAAGLSASEALENIPSVEVDQEGNVSLRGSQSVTIWINGKAQGLTSDNRGDILQQLPAESIEKIEVITNPSSKYSPEGSAGIINIILKRDRKAGYYGGVQLNAGYMKDAGWSGRGGANINYSSGILEAYANIGLGKRTRAGHGFSDRDFVNDGLHYGFLNSDYTNDGGNKNLFARAGVTWHFTTKDEIGVSLMGMRGLGKGERNSNYHYVQGAYAEALPFLPEGIAPPVENDYYRDSYNSDEPAMNNVSLNYRHEWKSRHTLEVEGSYNTFGGENETGYTSRLAESLGGSILSEQWQEGEMGNREWELRIDYEQPVGEGGKIEAGYRGNDSHENSPTETWTSAGKTQSIYGLYNRFIYDSHQHALYGNYQNRIGKNFGYQLGLRAEYWRVETESYNYDQEHGTSYLGGIQPVPAYSKDFFQLFPTVFLSYQLPNDQELQLNFTRRLRRPWGGQMNSFKNVSDSTSISFGNPELTPTYTSAFELNYLKTWENHTLSISTYYRPSTDVMQRVSYKPDQNQVTIYSTTKNLTKETSSGVEIIAKNKLFKRLDLTTTVNGYYYELEGGNFSIMDAGVSHPVSIQGRSDFSWNASMMAQLMLPWNLSMQATGRYSSARVQAQGTSRSSYSLDCGLRKTFLDRKFTLNINGRNLLDSRRFRSTTEAPGYYQVSEGVWGGRQINIQLSYSFGNMRAKGRPDRGEGMGEGGMERSSSFAGGEMEM